MLEFLAKLGLSVASTSYSFWYILDEPECPESLIK